MCHRLDGIPLAIELAAARVKVLSIEQINARLNDRFRLLTGGSRTSVARQRTLEATVDWSYELLSEPERQLLRRLSVFAGGWTIEAAEDVTSGDGIERKEVLDLLSRLVDKSLVNVDGDGDEGPRYRFLETVRQYGRERLLQSAEAERLRDRHLAFFRELARRAEPELPRAEQVSWLNRLHREHDNLRLAFEWCLGAPERGRAESGIRGGAVLVLGEARLLPRRTGVRGARVVGGHRCATGAPGQGAHESRQHDVLSGRFRPYARAGGREREAGPGRRRFVDCGYLPRHDRDDGVGAWRHGRVRPARHRRADCSAREHHADGSGSRALACLAYHAMHEGDLDRAGRLHEELLEMGRRQGEKWGMGIVLFDLALLRVVQGRHGAGQGVVRRGHRPRPGISEIGVASPGVWGFCQPPRRRTDVRSARPGSAAPWRVCSRASAHPFRRASTD